MNRAFRIAAFASLSVLIATACGSRVVPLEIGAVGPGGQPVVNPTATGTGIGPTISPTGIGTNPTDPGNPISNINKTSVPGDKPTDVGVTKGRIKLSLIASLTGPLPGQFDAAVEAVDTYFRMINAQGGICRRLVELIIYDDNGSGAQNLNVANRAATQDKVFAFVGSMSAPNDSGIATVSKKHKMPDIGFPLTFQRTEAPYAYGVPGQLNKRIIGEGANGSAYLNKLHGVKQMAIFWLKDSLVSVLNAWAFEAAIIKSSGGTVKVCHEQETGILDNNFDQYAVAMEANCDPADGPVAVYTVMENNSNIKLAKAMKSQGFKPAVFSNTFSSYLPSFIEQGGDAVEGVYVTIPHIPFERCGRDARGRPAPPCSQPELNRYVQALHQFKPNHRAPGSWGAPGWGQAELFTQAAIACGANLTRTCILKTLDSMGPFSANGFLSPTVPGAHVIYSADLILQIRNGKFVELRPNDKSGPPEAPDFWDQSELFDWWKFYCANKPKFPDTQTKDQYITC